MGREGYRSISVPEDLAVRLERLNPPTEMRPKDGREAAGLAWKIRAAVEEAVKSWRARHPGIEVYTVGEAVEGEGANDR